MLYSKYKFGATSKTEYQTTILQELINILPLPGAVFSSQYYVAF